MSESLPIVPQLRKAAIAFSITGDQSNSDLLNNAAALIEKQSEDVHLWQTLSNRVSQNYIELRNLVSVALAPVPDELAKLKPPLKLTGPLTSKSPLKS